MPDKSKTIVVMPAFNEAQNIGATITSVVSKTDLPILVVDDASSDGTGDLARELGARVLPLATQLGAWGATQAGIRWALKCGYETTITIDADGQHDAYGVDSLLDTMDEEKADLVIGSCTSRGSALRHIAWALFRFLSGLTIRDLTSGFRAYSHDSMKLIAKPRATALDYQDVGVLCLIRQAGLTIAETSVCMFSRKDGKSRIFDSWISVSRYMLYSTLLSLSHTNIAAKK